MGAEYSCPPLVPHAHGPHAKAIWRTCIPRSWEAPDDRRRPRAAIAETQRPTGGTLGGPAVLLFLLLLCSCVFSENLIQLWMVRRNLMGPWVEIPAGNDGPRPIYVEMEQGHASDPNPLYWI